MFEDAEPRLVAEQPRDFNTECRGILRQLEAALRETYFHPSRVPAGVLGDEGRAMPQQQQSVGPSRPRLARQQALL